MAARRSPLFLAAATADSAVGLGGGTGYVAIMVLVDLPAQNIPSTALVLNIGVAGTSLLRFGLAGRLKAGILTRAGHDSLRTRAGSQRAARTAEGMAALIETTTAAPRLAPSNAHPGKIVAAASAS